MIDRHSAEGAPLCNAPVHKRETTSRDPNDRGQGRKPLSPTGELMRSRPVRMTDAEWRKCKALGGAAFVRRAIERAKEPTP